jgi:hypothetical protein
MTTRLQKIVLALALTALYACESSDDEPYVTPNRADGGDARGADGIPDGAMDAAAPDVGAHLDTQSSADAAADRAPAAPPLYAIMYEVFNDNGSDSYLSLIDSLDVKQIDITKAREYSGGRAFLATYNGWLFVGDPTTPTITRFSVTPAGALKEEGKLGFGNFGLMSGALDPWNVTFISPEKAYLADFESGTHIIWNPTKMEIAGEIKAAPEFQRANVSLDGSPAVVRGNRMFRDFFWADYKAGSYSPDHLLAIYDTDYDKLLELVPETRCPAPGNLVQKDEQGNFYFSNWIWPVAGTLMKGAPKSCVLRLSAGATRFDADWTLGYADLAAGREGGMFTYLGGGKALVSIFHNERTMFDATTEPFEYAGSPVWRLWNVDLATRTAGPLEGVDFNAGAYTPVSFGGRSFLMVPGKDWAATQLYEVKDGRAVPAFEVKGWSYMFVQVR